MNAETEAMSFDEQEINIADIKSYEAWLRSLAWRILGNSDDVDDVVQDVWLANLRRKEPKGPSRAWLGSVTRNLSVSRVRRKSQRLEVERKAAREEELGETVQSAVEQASIYRRLLQWILDMDEPYRETLLLRFARDLKLREIARLMDVPDSTVRVRLRRGLVILRQKARSEFNEDRRQELLFALFGFDGSRSLFHSPKVAVLFAGVALTCVAVIWSFGGFVNDEGGTELNSSAIVDEGASKISEPSRHRAKVAPEIKSAEKVSTPTLAAAYIRGRLEFRLNGELYDAELRIQALPFMVGPAMDLPALRPPLPSFAAGFPTPTPISIRNGESFSIPVAEPGRYRLMISIAGVKGVLQFWSGTKHWTNAAQEPASKFELLDGLKIEHQPRAHGRYQIAWRHPEGQQTHELSFTAAETQVKGLYMPRLQFHWLDTRNDQVWIREINRAHTKLILPELGKSAPFVVKGAEPMAALSDVGLKVAFMSRDNVVWESALQINDPQRPLLFLPDPHAAKSLQVTASAAGFLAPTFDLKASALPKQIELRPKSQLEGEMIDMAGSKLEGAQVLVCDKEQVIFRGQVCTDLTFVLDSLGPLSPGLRFKDGDKLKCWVLDQEGIFGCNEAMLRDGQLLLQLPKPKNVKIRVYDEELKPIANAKVIVLPWDKGALSKLIFGKQLMANSDGQIAFGAICGGQWLLDFQAPGFRARQIMIDWALATAEQQTLVLKKSLRIQHRLEVTHGEGQGLPYAFIALGARAGKLPEELRTDQAGMAAFSLQQKQAVRFAVTYPGLAPSLRTRLETAAEEELTRIHMLPINSVACTVFPRTSESVWVRCLADSGALGEKSSSPRAAPSRSRSATCTSCRAASRTRRGAYSTPLSWSFQKGSRSTRLRILPDPVRGISVSNEMERGIL